MKYMTNPYPIMAIKPVTEEDEDDDEAVDAVSGNVEEAFVRVATELVMRHGGPRLSEKGADHIQLDSKDVADVTDLLGGVNY